MPARTVPALQKESSERPEMLRVRRHQAVSHRVMEFDSGCGRSCNRQRMILHQSLGHYSDRFGTTAIEPETDLFNMTSSLPYRQSFLRETSRSRNFAIAICPVKTRKMTSADDRDMPTGHGGIATAPDLRGLE